MWCLFYFSQHGVAVVVWLCSVQVYVFVCARACTLVLVCEVVCFFFPRGVPLTFFVCDMNCWYQELYEEFCRLKPSPEIGFFSLLTDDLVRLSFLSPHIFLHGIFFWRGLGFVAEPRGFFFGAVWY